MQIHILQVVDQSKGRSNKDTNGGYGTVNDFGRGIAASLLKNLKRRSMNYPEILPAYLIAILRKQGHSLSYGVNSVHPEAEMVLIQTSIINYSAELAWADRIRNEHPGIKIGFVGGMSSANPNLFSGAGNFVIQGEAENAFLKVDPGTLSGIFPAGLVEDLDDLPFPEWSHISEKDFRYQIFQKKGGGLALPVQSSRGCPMSCGYYCTYPLVQGSKIRSRSAENVVSELAYLQTEYPCSSVIFRDPIFTFDLPRVEEICTLLIERGIRLRWVCETHPRFLNPELIRLMAAAGCTAVKLGVESGDLSVMRKSHRSAPALDEHKTAIRMLESRGIAVLAFYILGYFSDTKASVEQTIRYAQELNTYGAQFTIATPYPGTAWHADLENQFPGLLDPDLEHYNQYRLVYPHPNLSFEELEKLKSAAYQRYYFRWDYIRKNILRI